MLRLRLARNLILVTNVLLAASGACAQPGLAALQSSLLGKTFFLRSLCAGDNLRFSASGAPIGNCARESFTVGLLTIDKIDVNSSELRLTTHRVGLIFQDDVAHMVDLSKPPQAGSKPHSVTLHIAAPTSGDYSVPLSATLTTKTGDLLPDLPEAWKGFLRSQPSLATANTPQQPSTEETKQNSRPVTQDEIDAAQMNPLATEDLVAPPAARNRATNSLPDALADGVTAKAGKNGVTLPKVLRMRDAEFSPQARSMRYSSECIIRLVVDEQGVVARSWVHRPAGLGLDEQALAAVAQYKFQPATKDGKPVAVVMSVAVKFQVF